MDTLATQIKRDTAEFGANRERMVQLVAELRHKVEQARQGGGPRAMNRHREQGKLPVRERIDALLDQGSPFLELAPLAANDMYDNDAPAAGVVAGIGRISGRE